VREVEPAARQLGELDVTAHHDRLGRRGDAADAEPRRHGALVHVTVTFEIGILLVRDHRSPGRPRVLERAPHRLGRAHRPPIVGERDRARGGERHHLGECLALLAERHRGNGMHASPDRFTPASDHPLYAGDRVDHGAGVGHREHVGEAARGGRPRARLDRLLGDWPGSRRCTCTSTKPGASTAPSASMTRAARRSGVDDATAGAGDVDAAAVFQCRAPRMTIGSFMPPPVPRTTRAPPARTATPFATWSSTTERVPSATSEAISTSRFKGPGCSTTAPGRMRETAFGREAPHARVFALRRQPALAHALVLEPEAP
jgi:hypothetical protein